MAVTILITGFGPFPGAPFNPTGPLVKLLARMRRPALADVTIVQHIFPTSYAAVDRELPTLIAKHKPDALLMFGLATRTPHLRIETRAHNALARSPDADGAVPRAALIAGGGPGMLALDVPARRLLAAAREARLPVALSRNAGRYLCNYLCWRAAEAARIPGGPRLTAFVHVPKLRPAAVPRARAKKGLPSLPDLVRAGRAILRATAAAAARR
jgi:pyroglutamyl-peptidase